MTPNLCVIGDPIEHSLSPRIHTAMLQELGREGSYTTCLVKRATLPAFLSRVRSGDFTGFNATMPLKTELLGQVDRLDRSAELAQSVNTVVREADGTLTGYSTDGDGFVEALRAMGREPAGADITLLGAGGAASSVAMSLALAGAAKLTVCARRRAAADELCQAIREAAPECEAGSAAFDPDSLRSACGGAQILVNGTSLGMDGQFQFEDLGFVDALPDGAAVCDMIYFPLKTELLRRADKRELKTMNGLPLLVWQGILALEKFLGEELDRKHMSTVALAAIYGGFMF